MDRLNLLLCFCMLLINTPSCIGIVFAERLSDRIIETKYGRLKGLLVDIPNEKLPSVEVYKGIQYASLLGGTLRFMPPTSATERWDGVKVAKKFGSVCPQKPINEDYLKNHMPSVRVQHLKRVEAFTTQQEEDCLNLNLYVPIPGKNFTESPPYPVVVFLHGDGYDFGTGNAYDGSILASFGQVIVVTLNYRLGALGFLSTYDNNSPGNYALLDIVAALQWIKESIAVFGGDRDRVTLMGQGTGGALANILALSPLTKDGSLFRRVILQSGSALGSWSVGTNPLRYTRKLANNLNCSDSSSNRNYEKMVSCLKDMSAQVIVNSPIQGHKYSCPFCPVIDGGSILPRHVETMLQDPDTAFSRVEFLLGVTREEGFALLKQSQVTNGITDTQRQKMIRTYVRNVYEFHRQKIFDILSHHYMDWERPIDSRVLRDNVMEMLGDGQFNVPMIKLGNYHAEKYKTFFYVFGYPSRGPDYPDWVAGIQGDDLIYVLGAPLVNGITPFRDGYSNGERMISEAVMRYFSNFVKSGNPNEPIPQTSVHGGRVRNRYQELPWPVFNLQQQQYIHIGMRPGIQHHYRGQKVALWLDLVPKVHRPDGLNAENHYLNDPNNMSSFEEGTREIDPRHIIPPPPTPPIPPPISAFTAVGSTTQPTTQSGDGTGDVGKTPPAGETDNQEKTTPVDIAMVEGTREPPISMSLSITIAVGCSLLFLNIIVFAGVYYQKDKLKFEKKLREKERERERLELERVRRDSISGNGKSNAEETDSLLEEGPHDTDSIAPTPQRNTSHPPSPILNHAVMQPTASMPPTQNLTTPGSPEKLLRRTNDRRFTPSPNLRRDFDSLNRSSDSTDSGTMTHNGSDDAPVTMV